MYAIANQRQNTMDNNSLDILQSIQIGEVEKRESFVRI